MLWENQSQQIWNSITFNILWNAICKKIIEKRSSFQPVMMMQGNKEHYCRWYEQSFYSIRSSSGGGDYVVCLWSKRKCHLCCHTFHIKVSVALQWSLSMIYTEWLKNIVLFIVLLFKKFPFAVSKTFFEHVFFALLYILKVPLCMHKFLSCHATRAVVY